MPGARELRVEFDPRCATEPTFDYLEFHTTREGPLLPGTERMHGVGNVANFRTITFLGESFWYYFHSDAGTEDWGFEFTVTVVGEGQEKEESSEDFIALLMRRTAPSCAKTATVWASHCLARLVMVRILQDAEGLSTSDLGSEEGVGQLLLALQPVTEGPKFQTRLSALMFTNEALHRSLQEATLAELMGVLETSLPRALWGRGAVDTTDRGCRGYTTDQGPVGGQQRDLT